MPRHFSLLGLLLLAGCTLVGPDADRLTLYVGPDRVDCAGAAPQQCLLVRERATAPWTLFYDEIEGFIHQEGFSYQLVVERLPVANPPQDGASLRYRLVRVLTRQPAS